MKGRSNRFLLLLLLLVFACKPEGENRLTIESPDSTLKLIIELDQGYPRYSIFADDKPIILSSGLGYKLRDSEDLSGPFVLLKYKTTELLEDWTPVWGQEKRIHSHSFQTKLEMEESKSPRRKLNLYFRVFNDGVAFRYEIPEQPGLDSLFITKENTEFNFAEDGQVWWIPANYNSYEQVYTRSYLSELLDSVHTPLTMKSDGGYFISLHEANLTNYPSMTLQPSKRDSLEFVSSLVPWSDGDKVKTVVPMVSPWRTIMIGRSALDLQASRMILNLNEPSRLKDVTWIKPMKYIGIWWGLHIGKHTWTQGDRHGATTANVKAYIDFAAANNIQGVLAEGWNHDWERYGQEKAFNFTRPYDDFDIEEITRYAREKNIALIGHHETGREAPYYDEQLEEAYAFLSEHGIAAVKTGYAGDSDIYPIGEAHHGQWMVQHYRRVVEMAAKYKVALNIHEPIKPTGIERTWPHVLTREGSRGMEWNAWSEGNPPNHTTILPFTRLLAGPLDYTPGIFDLHFNQYKPDNRVYTTLAKQLALMVVIYSPLQMAADLIENYMDQPAFQFIRDLKVDWDETVYLEAEIGEQVALARRAGEEWFLGAISNEQERELSIPLNKFLSSEMIAECYVDGGSADWEDDPYSMWIGSYLANPADTLKVKLARGGGTAIRFRPVIKGESVLDSIANLAIDQIENK